MKTILFALLLPVAVQQNKCTRLKYPVSSTCYKARLEIKGICANYTLKLLEGSLESTKTEASWKDEVTGKVHTNVFALGNPCSFPDSLKEGDEFYFKIDTTKQNCTVCMAYYPKPAKAISIKVLNAPCN